MTESKITIRKALISETLEVLRKSGSNGSEGIVLWLGRKHGDAIEITEIYVPDHEAEYDYFRIPPRAISELLNYLGREECFVVAQVHSHPKEAFHSCADDKWAIIRHEGALSLVVPYFARTVAPETFLNQMALFCLTAENVWSEIDADKRKDIISISE